MSETITDEDKLECAKRELKMRQRAYPRWISNGKITSEKAAREIALMEAIMRDYEAALKIERLL